MKATKKAPCFALGLLVLGTPPGVHGQEPELVGPGVVSTDERHETFPALDPVDGSLWFSVYTSDFEQQTILRAGREGDMWALPEVAPFSGRWSDRAPRFSPDGRRLYFTSNRPLPGNAAPGRLHIWQVDRRPDGGWSPPRPAPGVDANSSDFHSAATASGALYVASTRPGRLGPYDLFRLGPDGSVVHLPAPLNSEHALTDVWVSADERWMILVIANHPSGLGRDDLYVSRVTDGRWGAPRNLGAPTNSREYEYGPNVSPDGRYLYFTSHRRGSADIFRVPLRALGRAVGQ